MKYAVILLFIVLGTIACSRHDKTMTTDPRLEAFHAFIRKFPVLRLPIQIRDDQDVEKGKPRFDNESEDTLFVKGANCCYGLLPDTTRYYGVIVLFPADVLVPYIYTFTKSGKLISSVKFFLGGCGPDPEIVYCSSSGTLDKNLNVYCADSVQMQDVDSSGNAIRGTSASSVTYLKGNITKSGKIIYGTEQTLNLEKNIK